MHNSKMCDDSLAALKLYNALYADDGLLYFDEDCSNVTFCCDEMGILIVNLVILMKMIH